MTIKEYREILKKKNKFHAVKETIDGITFDSKAEAEFYQLLKSDRVTQHIDCHVPVTLQGGVRFKVDFIRWHYPEGEGLKGEAIEVKGKETSDFRIKRNLFDSCHPLAPLQVFRKERGKWVCA